MERFTKKIDGVWHALCEYGRSPCPIVTQEVIDRLAAYEDTGFTPEEVQQMRWIPVEERLPGVSGNYICAVKDKNGSVWTIPAEWSLEMKMWIGAFGEIKNVVTHWMPLPPSPQILSGNTKGGKER